MANVTRLLNEENNEKNVGPLIDDVNVNRLH